MSLFDVIKHPISSIHDEDILNLPRDVLYSWAIQFLKENNHEPDDTWSYDSELISFLNVIKWTCVRIPGTVDKYRSTEESMVAERRAVQVLLQVLEDYDEPI